MVLIDHHLLLLRHGGEPVWGEWFWSGQGFLLWGRAMLADGNGLWHSPGEERA